ncbi:hypothetical protein LSAT2_003779 [Lamellibrachia satsuma]|nr:hypothetical protein LSAT2_003779 [Lamellibrachia satsuma]
MSVCLSACLPAYPSVHPPINPPTLPPIHPFTHPPILPFPAHPPTNPPTQLPKLPATQPPSHPATHATRDGVVWGFTVLGAMVFTKIDVYWENVTSRRIRKGFTSIDVSQCGKQKGCFRYISGAKDCDANTCKYLLTYKRDGNLATFELSAKADWVSVGFSSDDRMGGDDVLVCVRTRSDAEVRHYFTNYNHVPPTLMTSNPLFNTQGRQLHRTEDEEGFSMIAIDQAHEQNNACIKRDSALLRCMVAGPEVDKAIEEFQDGDEHWGRRASHAARHGHHKILNRTTDTDVVELAVSVTQGLQLEDELSLAFATCKSFRYLAAHEIAAGLRPETAWALPMFHALTGCDAWAIWTVLPELTDELLELFAAPSDIPEDVMHAIDRFVIRLYERPTHARNSSQRRTMST